MEGKRDGDPDDEWDCQPSICVGLVRGEDRAAVENVGDRDVERHYLRSEGARMRSER